MEMKVFIQEGCLPISSVEQINSNPHVIVSLIDCKGDFVSPSKDTDDESHSKWEDGIYICKFDFFEELVNCPHIRWRIPVNNNVDVNLLIEDFDKIVERCLKISRVDSLIKNNSICLEIKKDQKKDLELTKRSLENREDSSKDNKLIASYKADIALVDEEISVFEKEIYKLSLQKLLL